MTDTARRANGETYFFRDHGQFDLLRLHLLPELIERRRGSRVLRLWSAGCASGEEAYSLAMLVDMVLPEREGWNLFLLGSDIDRAALAKAQRARYGQWSFRMVPQPLQQRYFRRDGDEWILDERIRRMVTFRAVNLIDEPFLSDELCDMDLILCRNVFIYFSADAVRTVADKLAASLSEGGYLMTGHTELIGHRVPTLRSRLFAEGVVYQRGAPAVPAIATKPPSARHVTPPRHHAPAPRPSRPPPPAAPDRDELLATARGLADRGDYDRAEQACRQALREAPLASEPHFLLAQLAQLQGNFEQAGKLLDKTLYLDPHCVAAYLELAALCERSENPRRAKTLRRTALDIVRTLPGDTVIAPYETTTAEIAQWLAQ